jgi:hypothetical protein
MTTTSTPAPAVRPAWKDALFNYGTLVAVVIAVLGTLFGQISGLREQGGIANQRLSEIERRLGKAEERDEKLFEMVAALQASNARIEAQLQAKP